MICLTSEIDERRANSLPHAPARQQLEVAGVDDQSDDGLRLQALGICDGRSIELVRTGDPIIVRVMGSRIGISRRLAQQVRVLHR